MKIFLDFLVDYYYIFLIITIFLSLSLIGYLVNLITIKNPNFSVNANKREKKTKEPKPPKEPKEPKLAKEPKVKKVKEPKPPKEKKNKKNDSGSGLPMQGI